MMVPMCSCCLAAPCVSISIFMGVKSGSLMASSRPPGPSILSSILRVLRIVVPGIAARGLDCAALRLYRVAL